MNNNIKIFRQFKVALVLLNSTIVIAAFLSCNSDNHNNAKNNNMKTNLTYDFCTNKDHSCDLITAAGFIKAFHDTFKVAGNIRYIGGTVSKDELLKIISDTGDVNAGIKYHFCFNDRKLFLAFEYAVCPDISEEVSTNKLLYISFNDLVPYASDYSSPDKVIEFLEIPNKYSGIIFKADSIDVENFKIKFVNTFGQNSSERYNPSSAGFFFYHGIKDLLADTNCVAVRYYFGLNSAPDSENKIRVILVGVDKDGNNLKIYKESSNPKLL